MKPDEAWLDLSEVTDRTSPSEPATLQAIRPNEKWPGQPPMKGANRAKSVAPGDKSARFS
jgi:hypothetical protein